MAEGLRADQVVLRPSKLRWAALLAGSVAFCAGGVLMVSSGEATGWLVLSFFGLCGVVSMTMLFSKNNYLVLAPAGFTIHSLFRQMTISWSNVESFGTYRLRGSSAVMFLYSPDFPRSRALRGLNRAVTGYDGGLPDTYGLRADRLAALMNDWKQRYGINPGSSSAGPGC